MESRIAVSNAFSDAAQLGDVLASPEAFRFIEHTPPALGYQRRPVWVRLSAASDEAGHFLLLDNANLDHVTVYQNVVGQGWQSLTLGTHHAYRARPIHARSLVFPLDSRMVPNTPVYMRVASETSVSLPLSLATYDRMQEHLANRNTRAALFLGVLLALALYHCIIYFVVFDRAYLWFSLSSLFYVGYLLCLEGFAQQWVAPDATAGLVSRWMLACFFLASFFFYGFLTAILATRLHAPGFHRYLKVLQWGFLGLMGIVWVIPYAIIGPLSVAYGALSTVFGVAVTVRIAWAGHGLARWFMAMWAMFTVASTVRVLRLIGIGPAELTGEWVIQLVSAIGFLFLALALAQRIRALQVAEHLALTRAMQAEQSANQLLEYKVAQRTRELRVEKDYLEYLADARSRFFAHANHEIRTPITAILQYVGFLQRGVGCAPPETPAAAYLDVVYQHAQRIHQLANQWLDQERLQTLEALGTLEDVTLEPLLNSLLQRLSVIFVPGVKTSFEIMPGGERVKGRQDYLECVLENLLSNAAKHTTEGQVSVRVEPCAPVVGRRDIKISVTDTGVGVREEDQQRIFEPFQQGTGETRQGAGLGLATCRVYVSRMGGNIGVTAVPGGGASFWFTLRAVE